MLPCANTPAAGPNAEARRHVGRFLVVGVVSVGIDLACYTALLAMGLSTPYAKGAGYLAGMTLGFVLNKNWTFGSRRAAGGEVASYVLLYAVTFVVNIAVNSGMLVVTACFLSGHWPSIAAFLAATGLTTIINFLGLRFITFRKGIQEQRVAGP